MTHQNIRREIAERYHRELPDEIRAALKGRGIPATLIERQLLGWNGERVTIPVFGPGREVLGFRYARLPDDPLEVPEVLSDLQLGTELYGWEALERAPQRLVVCDGELDRLVLEGNGFAAVTSTSGAHDFPREWLPHFAPVKQVYICFARDLAGAAAAKKVQQLLPRARIVKLPPEVGVKGRATDFFVGLGYTKIDFELLLAAAESATGGDPGDEPPNVRPLVPHDRSLRHRAERVRRTVRLHEIIANYTDLHASGAHLVGHCPFHDSSSASLEVYASTNAYQCNVCDANGDVITFLMEKESMTIGQAVEALERFLITHELYGTS